MESGEPLASEAAAALMPPDMLGYLEGGERAQARARQTLEFVRTRRSATGPRGETLVFRRGDVRLLAHERFDEDARARLEAGAAGPGPRLLS